MRQQWFVGCRFGQRTAFKYHTIPLAETHADRFDYCYGPFKTARGARYFANHLSIYTADVAEYNAKLESEHGR